MADREARSGDRQRPRAGVPAVLPFARPAVRPHGDASRHEIRILALLKSGNAFRLVYIAYDIATAIAETIIRDEFEGASDRVLDETEIEKSAVAEVVLDLRTTGLLRLGVSTDAARGKAHGEGRKLSEAIYGAYAVDALLYSSRLTAANCLAVYDRAVPKLNSTAAVPLLRHPDLIPASNSIGVKIWKSR